MDGAPAIRMEELVSHREEVLQPGMAGPLVIPMEDRVASRDISQIPYLFRRVFPAFLFPL
jgi:hypothetical protein